MNERRIQYKQTDQRKSKQWLEKKNFVFSLLVLYLVVRSFYLNRVRVTYLFRKNKQKIYVCTLYTQMKYGTENKSREKSIEISGNDTEIERMCSKER